jgi:hypothetical protein
MEEYMYIVAAVGFIFGILQIILFVKLWIMTDDIRKIKNKYLGNEVIEAQPQIQDQSVSRNKSMRVVSILFVLTSLIGIYFMPMWVAIMILFVDIVLLAYVFTRK